MNKLEEFVAFEHEVSDLVLSNLEFDVQFIKPTSGRLSINEVARTKIIFTLNGQNYYGMLDRVIVHQIGKRIFEDKLTDGNKNEYYPVFLEWHKLMSENETELIQRIKSTICGDDLIMRFIPKKNNKIYGFISTKFEHTDQISFRNNLLESDLAQNCFDINSSKMYHINKGIISSPVKEYFEFISPNEEIKLSCGITYGMNNGYGAYGVHWVRRIFNTDTWLTPLNGGMGVKSDILFKWKNNPRYHEGNSSDELNKFLRGIIEEGERIIDDTSKLIQKSKEVLINDNQKDDILRLIKVAYATKERVLEALNNDKFNRSNTLFQFSEAIRHVGTFDNYTPQATKRLLIEVGTNILDYNEFDEILKNDKEIVLSGSYDWY